jgi:class 3 adenylate cyclase
MIGILALGRTHGGDTLTSEDLEVLRSLAAGVGLAVARSLDAARTERMALHRQVLERHLPATSVRNVLAKDPGPPGTHRARVTTLYLRLRGFNAYADRVGPDVTVALLREYYAICDAVIHQHGGTTERYDGARVVAIFGDPVATADHAACAVRAALAVRQAIEARRAAWRQQGYDLVFGIGVASGFANVGFVGSGNRGTYAALGTTVDVAERLCDLATAGDILAPRMTVADIGAEIQVSDAGEHPIAGLAAPLAIARIEAAAPA